MLTAKKSIPRTRKGEGVGGAQPPAVKTDILTRIKKKMGLGLEYFLEVLGRVFAGRC